MRYSCRWGLDLARFYAELKRRKVIRVLVAYIVAAWLVLQVADVLSSMLSLPDWAPKLVLFLLAIGFVPALMLAWAFEVTPDGIKRDSTTAPADRTGRSNRFHGGIIASGLIFIVGIGLGAYWLSGVDERWAKNIALPLIEQSLADNDVEQAYAVSLEMRDRLPDTDLLDPYWNRFTWRVSIPSDPPGATVYHRAYDDPAAPWVRLGETPMQEARIPYRYSLLRFELDGYEDLIRTFGSGYAGTHTVSPFTDWDSLKYFVPPYDVVLETSAEALSAFTRVPGGYRGIDGDVVQLADFRIGRHEVTNREFREFVNAGGYRRRDLWEHEFRRDGRVVSWEDAMADFVDSTGRPGPSTWVGGTFPAGEDDYPVGGISWYEAAAYARFAGFELPTLHHWRRAHAAAGLTWQVTASNVEKNGPSPVGQFNGTGWTGTEDMLGNVREWCLNALGDQRVIVGSSWSDVSYAVIDTIRLPSALPPFDRSPQNGMRLAATNDSQQVREATRKAIEAREPITAPVVASDEAFDVMLRNFDYSDDPLNAVIEESFVVDGMTVQHISLDSGDGQRSELLLFLPDHEKSRYPVVVFWPGADVRWLKSFDQYNLHPRFLLASGRAVAMPIFESIFHRGTGSPGPLSNTMAGRDMQIRQVRELRRIIDYLETRPDMATDSLAYYGLSWGAWIGPLALVADPRLKVAILNQAGLLPGLIYDVNPAHYLPRVRQPVLQFNGLYDPLFSFQDSAKPFFDLVGSQSKKHITEPTGHFSTHTTVIRETLAWLDEHLGTAD